MDFVTFPIYGEFAFSQTSNAVIYTLTTFPGESYEAPDGSWVEFFDRFDVILTDQATQEEWEMRVSVFPSVVTPDEAYSFDFPTQGPSGGPPPSSLTRQIVIPIPAPGHYLEFNPYSAPTLGTVSIVDDTRYSENPERAFTFTYTLNSTVRNVEAWDSFKVHIYNIYDSFDSFVTVNIYLPPTSEPIVVTNQVFSGPAGSPLSGNMTATGGEGSLEFAVANEPSFGTVAVSADGGFTYTPSTIGAVNDTFAVHVTDGVTAIVFTVTIILTAPPLNEIIDPDQQFTGDPRFPIEGSVAQLSGAAEITYSLGSSPSFGSVVIDTDGHFTYIASDIAQPGDSFTALSTDGSGESVTIAVALVFDIDETVPTTGTVGPGKGGSNGGETVPNPAVHGSSPSDNASAGTRG